VISVLKFETREKDTISILEKPTNSLKQKEIAILDKSSKTPNKLADPSIR
jgi:hypothetical protein